MLHCHDIHWHLLSYIILLAVFFSPVKPGNEPNVIWNKNQHLCFELYDINWHCLEALAISSYLTWSQKIKLLSKKWMLQQIETVLHSLTWTLYMFEQAHFQQVYTLQGQRFLDIWPSCLDVFKHLSPDLVLFYTYINLHSSWKWSVSY